MDFIGTFTRFRRGRDMAAEAMDLHFLISRASVGMAEGGTSELADYEIIKLSKCRTIKSAN